MRRQFAHAFGRPSVSALSLVPRNRAARQMGWFARTPASRWLTQAFVAAYGVDLDEAEGDLADYPTLEALFVWRRIGLYAAVVDHENPSLRRRGAELLPRYVALTKAWLATP